MNIKGLVGCVILLVILGVAGFLYRAVLERPVVETGACTTEAKICPDGTAVGRVGPSCAFAPCPLPNVDLATAHVSFAVPAGYQPVTLPDASALAAYSNASASTSQNEIVVRAYPIPAGESALQVIYATALGDASGAPVSPSTFSAATLGGYTYSMVVLGRFEGVVHVGYYLPQGSGENQVLRFDSVDQDVANWTDPSLDIAHLPVDSDLRSMLATLQAD